MQACRSFLPGMHAFYRGSGRLLLLMLHAKIALGESWDARGSASGSKHDLHGTLAARQLLLRTSISLSSTACLRFSSSRRFPVS